MNINSIRWRLPISYAAIAFLATLSLGAILLLVLSSYYGNQERAYLHGNALSLRPFFAKILQNNPPPGTLQNKINSLAFLSQSQIRILNVNGEIIVDSGVPNASQILALSDTQANMIYINRTENVTPQGSPSEGQNPAAQTETLLPVSASPYGYGFAPLSAPASLRRSSQIVSAPLTDARGTPLGTLELSHGPSYGEQMLDAVSLAWLAASIIAIALAALAGWVASLEVTRPVLALTNATRFMEQGNFSARANFPDNWQVEEFQTLANSFNSIAQRVEDTVTTLHAFVSDAAYALNGPLTALKTNLELATNEPDCDQQAVFLLRAIEQNRRLELLTSGLLDLSRIEVSQSAADREPVQLRSLVAEAGGRFAARAKEARHIFQLDLPKDEINIHGNELQLEQAINNLLENALKFIPKGGAICLQLQQKDDQAILTVTDTGIGILPEDLPRLFGRFHHHGVNSTTYPGSGLGLATVKAIVAAHGGHVHVESAGPEQGSQFTVILPA